MPKKYTTSEFIEKAKQIHGDLYNYSEVDYLNSKEKVKIFCKKCKAYFWQIPGSHLLGSGCKKCHTGEIHLTKEDFIKKANVVHNNKYDYSEVEWINSNTKVKIKCKKCNKIFLQSPHSHLYGQGCAHCAYSLSTEDFIKKAQIIHGNKYDYTNSVYSGINKAITIKCNNCGKNFTQLAISHLKGGKCPFCIKHIKSIDSFIKKAKKIHKNNYNYDQVIYKGSNTKIKIYCNKCKHYFEQNPATHLRGSGCPFCAISKGEIKVQNWLTTHNITFISQKRFKDCRDKLPLPFDFYLPDYNLCIEYQGQQHYNLKFFMGKYKKKYKLAKKMFNTLKKHDKIKKIYCKKNNIHLLEIKYNQNIEKILIKKLKTSLT